MKWPAALLAILIIFAPALYADRGVIPFKPSVKIFEPTQRAIIAWNGQEEILLLSTDLQASQPTAVLEVLPLPSEPIVKKGDVEVFKRATTLINSKLARKQALGADSVKRNGEAAHAPSGEVTFHQKIGPHDISVTHVLHSRGFISWVEKYLKSAGVDNPIIPESIKVSVTEYLADGFSWFVFDVIDLDEFLKTNDAIQYRFATQSLFYPMRISRTGEGSTSVELLILTPRLLSNFPGIPLGGVRLMHEPISISSYELRSLNEEMDALLDHREDMKLRIWRITGKINAYFPNSKYI